MHPATPDLLSAATAPPGEGEPAVLAHLRSCRACSELLRLAGLEVSTVAPDAPEDPGGERARYVDWRPLHASAMGRLFAARDTRLGRDVALKLPPSAADCPDPAWRAELRLRFENEARLAARLDHPAIVAIHETGHFADGEPYFTMQLVRGVPIDRALGERKTLRERLELLGHVAAAAEAVAFAHDRGIVHRDLKPANLMAGPFGETVVIDWGLARDIGAVAVQGDLDPDVPEAPGELTRFGVGTPHYMPPEQAQGAPADPGMDIFALGATVYHLVAGVPPYGGAGAGLVRARLAAGPPPSLRTLCPDAPRALVDITERCMERRPEDRYSDALEVARELRRFLSGELTRTRPPTPVEWLRHWARRHRSVLALSAAFSLVLLAGGAVAVWRIVEERDAALQARVAAEANERAARSERARALGHLAGRWATVPARRLSALAAGVAAVAEGLSSGEAPPAETTLGLAEALAAGPGLRPLEGPGGELTGLGFSPEGDLAVAVSAAGSLRLWRVADGAPLATHGGLPPRPYGLRFPRQGRHFAVWGLAPEIRLFSTDDPAAPGRVLEGMTDAVHNVAFSPDGAEIAAIAVTGDVARWSTRDGRLLARTALGAGSATVAVISGGPVFVGRSGGEIVRLRPGAAPESWRAHETEVLWTDLSRDAATLYTASAAGRITAWNLGASDALPPRHRVVAEPAPGAAMNGLRRARDGARLAAGFTDGARFVDLATGRATFGISGFGHADQFTPEGDLFLDPDYAGGGCTGRGPEDGRRRFHLATLAPGARQECTPSPDGRRALWAGAGPDPVLFDAERSLASGMLDGFGAAVVALGPCGSDLCGAAADGRLRRWSLPEGAPLAHRSLGSEPTVVLARPEAWWVGLANGDTVEVRDDGLVTWPGAGPVAALGLCPPTATRPPLRLDLDGVLRALRPDGPPEPVALPEAGVALACSADEVVVAGAEGRLHRPPAFAGGRDPWPARVGGTARIRRLELEARPDRLWVGLSDGSTLAVRRGDAPRRIPGRLLGVASGALTAGDEGTLTLLTDAGTASTVAGGLGVLAWAADPGASLLATVNADGALRIWSTPALALRWSVPGRPAAAPTAVTFARGPGGQPLLVTGQADGAVLAWPVSAQDAVLAACHRLRASGFPADAPEDARTACARALPPAR